MAHPQQNVLSEDEVKRLLVDVVQNECITEPVYTIKAGSSKGDGYMSFMTRVDVESIGKKLHLIMKCAPKTDLFRSFIRTTFLREISFYTEIYPCMAEFQKEMGIEDCFRCIPKYYKSAQKDGEELLVMENIRECGFQLWDRKTQFDDAHLKMLFKEYAKFHSISFALQHYRLEKYYDLSKDIFDLFTPGIFSFDFFGVFKSSLEQLHDIYEDDEIKRDIFHLKDNVTKYFEHIINNKGKRVVITHGDCWSSNMMFKYDDPNNPGKPSDLCLLDFQLVRKGSPVLDLSYFFYAGAPKHLLNKLEDYLKLYYSVLTKQLKNFRIDVAEVISFDELKTDWKIYCKFGYLMSLMVIKSSLIEIDEIMDMSDLKTDEEMSITKIYQQKFKNQDLIYSRLKDLTDHLHENGFLRFQY